MAIKVLRAELGADPRTKRRFLREAYLVNRVQHEGVVPILDDNESDDGVVFLVMELLEGTSVEDLVRDGACEASEVAFVGHGLLDILIAAHRSGIVHRDVKPSNVFLMRSGTLRLLDFGIARQRTLSPDNATRDGAILGTAGFMAPEQARGRWDEVDARTDVWAVGATMFRLLTGRRVHERGTRQECMIAAATEPAPSVASIRTDLPASLVAVVDKALSFDAAKRFQSALEMQEALAAVRAELPPPRGAWPRDVAPAEDETMDGSQELLSMSYFDESQPVERASTALGGGRAARAIGIAAFSSMALLGVSRWAAQGQTSERHDVAMLATPVQPKEGVNVPEPVVVAAPVPVPVASAPSPVVVAKARVRLPPKEPSLVEAAPSSTAEPAPVAPARVAPLEDFLDERR